MIHLTQEQINILTPAERKKFDPADAEMLALLREFGPQPATALVTALGVKRSTINFRASLLGNKVVAVQAPGRGNVTVYAAA
jgi:hypothetical protein